MEADSKLNDLLEKSRIDRDSTVDGLVSSIEEAIDAIPEGLEVDFVF